MTALTVAVGNAPTLSWQNRTTAHSKIIIERRVNDGAFNAIAELNTNAVEFADPNTSSGNSYYYRVIASFSNAKDYYSYPVKIDF